jgi:hypothetical protein
MTDVEVTLDTDDIYFNLGSGKASQVIDILLPIVVGVLNNQIENVIENKL